MNGTGKPKTLPPLETPELYVIEHKWAQSPRFVGKTLAQIFEMEGGAQALLEMYEWAGLEQHFPGERAYLEEFIKRDPKRRQVFALIAEELKNERKRKARQMRRLGDTHANRERQAEFGF